jgi:CNT family concentrative nucleoside transporter
MNQHFVSFLGFLALVLIACIFSTNRRRINWRAIGAGLILQLVIGLVVFRLPLSRRFFVILNDLVMAVLDASKAGTGFLLGPLAIAAGETGSIGFILAFQALPIAIFFSALVAALYHLRLMQPLIRVFARIFHRTLGISGAEALSSSSNIFVGVESALVVQPYLALMTRSELYAAADIGDGHGRFDNPRHLCLTAQHHLSSDCRPSDLSLDYLDTGGDNYF